jgi:predicted amino acid racemase
MAVLKLYREKLAHNFNYLNALFLGNEIEWGVVTKLLCGTKLYLQELVRLGVREMHDTRISNLKMIKSIAPDVQTVYIKPPARRSITNVINYADVSFNTSISTIRLLSEAAVIQNKQHKIIIMVEMGDLREGVIASDLLSFYSEVFALPNIFVVGLGTNFNCLNGIMPTEEKLSQLCRYKSLIETTFNHNIPWVSGGTSVTLSLLINQIIPDDVNHFRVGEALFFANDLFTGKTFEGMQSNVFELEAEIIEVKEKPIIPDGEQQENVAGYIPTFNPEDIGRTAIRAIIDVGLLDINPKYLIPKDVAIEIIEASSDMLVINLKDNPLGYRTGDTISFNTTYMGALGLLNSYYVEKIIV